MQNNSVLVRIISNLSGVSERTIEFCHKEKQRLAKLTRSRSRLGFSAARRRIK